WQKQRPTCTTDKQYNSMEGSQAAQVGGNNNQPAPSKGNTTAWKATRQRRLAKTMTNLHLMQHLSYQFLQKQRPLCLYRTLQQTKIRMSIGIPTGQS
ncbi:MAG: hypothetical protein NC335_12140, partial [Bacteroides sp.]|nr:hypothetical protein [Bacteroides sp.]